MSTAHNSAPKKSISKLVIVTGDPLRCKRVAETYLKNLKLLSEVRNVYCYTGTYKDLEISMMAHGMGMGSMGIYSYELFAPEIYDADLVIRVGTCGGLSNNLELNELVLVESISSNSNYAELLEMQSDGEIKVDFELLKLTKEVALNLKYPLKPVKNFSTDNFYTKYSLSELGVKTGCDTVEMESYALAINAIYHKKKFLTILSVSDIERANKIVELTSQQREENLSRMFILALETLVEYAKKNYKVN